MTKRHCDICNKEMCNSNISMPDIASPYHVHIISGDVHIMTQVIHECSTDLCINCYDKFLAEIETKGILVRISMGNRNDYKLFDNTVEETP